VAGHALTGDVTLAKADVGLGNVPNTDCSTTANITDATNKRFCTDAEKTVIGNTSGVNTGNQTLPTDATIAITDVTTNNAGTTKHGWSPKVAAPAANQLVVVGIGNGETVISGKTIIGATTPSTQAFGDTAAHGTSVEAAAADHKHAMPAAPTASSVGLGSVTNDAQTKASVVPNTAPSSGQIPVGNAGGTAYAPVTVSGDGTLASTGALAITKLNGTSLVGLGTGLLKNTTETGVPSIAVSGTDIKTINSTSLLGSGNINIAGGSVDQGNGVESVATSGGTTTLTLTSPADTVFTGTANQTCVLPNATTLPASTSSGWEREIDNNSTGTIVVVLNDTTTVLLRLAPGTYTRFRCLTNGTTNGTWEVDSPHDIKPAMFPSLDIFGHSYVATEFGIPGSPYVSPNQIALDGMNIARLIGGRLGSEVINHAINGSQLTKQGRSLGGFSKVLTEIRKPNTRYPFAKHGGALLLVYGINDIANNTVANQALVRTTYQNCIKAIISKWRASVLFPAKTGGAGWTFGANYTTSAAANLEWNDGQAMTCTAVDSAGTSTATFTIPAGYRGEPITFLLVGNNSANACIVTWGGTITGTSSIVGATTTINGTSIDAHGPIPVRFTAAANGLSAANAGQTITVRVTTSTSGTFELCGAWIEAFKPAPALVCNVPRLSCKTYLWACGDGVGAGTTTLSSATAGQFSSTYDLAGAAIVETDAQAKIPSNTTLSSVTSATAIVCNNSIASGTSIQFTLARTMNGYKQSYYTTNTDFSGATVASHSAADGHVTSLNTAVATTVAGFDTSVGIVDLDALFASDASPPTGQYSWFCIDGMHPSDIGSFAMWKAIFDAGNLLRPVNDGSNLGALEFAASPAYVSGVLRRGVASGLVRTPAFAAVSGTAYTCVAGVMFFVPIIVTEPTEQWTSLLLEQTNAPATAGSNIRVGLYDDWNWKWKPQDLRTEFTGSAFAMGTTSGMKTVASFTLPVKPGLYWIGIKVDSLGTTASQIRAFTGPVRDMPPFPATSFATAVTSWQVTGLSAGALPTIAPSTIALVTSQCPIPGIVVNAL
jgi:hypothetical protein